MSQDLNHLLKNLKDNIKAEFYPYTSIKHTIRKRKGSIYIRISDTFADAPEAVLLSLGRILLSKLHKEPVDKKDLAHYDQYVNSKKMQKRMAGLLKQRKITIIKGRHKNLHASFERVNRKYFQNSMEKPVLTWSSRRATRTLGKYDQNRDIVSISPLLDSPDIPDMLLDFIMYHELLHKKHGITVKGKRRRIHTPEFKKEEKKFDNYQKMTQLMEKLSKCS